MTAASPSLVWMTERLHQSQEETKAGRQDMKERKSGHFIKRN